MNDSERLDVLERKQLLLERFVNALANDPKSPTLMAIWAEKLALAWDNVETPSQADTVP